MNKKAYLLYSIFVLSIISLMINLIILFGWLDIVWENNGVNNNGNGYTVAYWFVHLSYWQLIFILTWTSFEMVIGDKRDIFLLRYFAITWSLTVATLFLPSYIGFLRGDIGRLINGADSSWQGVPYIAYSILDIFQLTSFHFIIPGMALAYLIMFGMSGKEKMKSIKKSYFAYSIMFLLFLFAYSMIATSQGVKPGYPILDWPNDGTTYYGWSLWAEILSCVGFLVMFTIIQNSIMNLYIKKTQKP